MILYNLIFINACVRQPTDKIPRNLAIGSPESVSPDAAHHCVCLIDCLF